MSRDGRGREILDERRKPDPKLFEQKGKKRTSRPMAMRWCSANCLFVLETIRTRTMRVIHITVKTEETQILRIKYVLVLSYLNSNTT